MPAIELPHNWDPRPYQRPLWEAMERGCKRAVAVWHRRAGKDDVCLHWAATAAMQRIGTYWHMLPLANQARKAIWDAVNPHTGKRRIDEAFPLAIRETTREQEMFIRFKNGSTWQVIGSDNYDSIVGSPPVGVVFSEWALADPRAWAYLRPILAENGGWAFFIYTPRGKGHGYSTLKTAQAESGWFAHILTADDTSVFKKETLEAERRQLIREFGQTYGEALYDQEYFVSFDAAILGAYWGREMAAAEKEGRVCDLPYDESLPVYTAWDLGVDDSTAIWFFQVLHGGLHFIDHYESSGVGLDHYVDVIEKRGYRYAADWVPHDARVKEWGSGKTRVETMSKMGRKPRLIPDHKLMDGINAARVTLPRSRFDKTKCEWPVEALKQYRSEYDEERRVLKQTPLHDWTSHTADAYRYACMAWRALKEETKPEAPKHTFMANESGAIVSTATIRELIERKKRRREARA